MTEYDLYLNCMQRLTVWEKCGQKLGAARADIVRVIASGESMTGKPGSLFRGENYAGFQEKETELVSELRSYLADLDAAAAGISAEVTALRNTAAVHLSKWENRKK